MTGHHTNSTGNSCPTKKWQTDGRCQFVSKQFCKNFDNMVNHIPGECPQLPGNEAIKAEMEKHRANRKARQARRAAETPQR